ncbi:uncharacterized protein MYCFIDRAFT_198701 [Pseudocercospora fijiensis CIRAD86]|uniref:Uncharacterized protein n=1 Tax=Pseudocercospora fijiensis (strain CIRAD86) TaxID=383855 RepID=M2ZN01_PSEFD|nr:uncharacterized protein MYCFIDRAFT_198701 [Pseudocercospora fijiensis CIRAD86]EME80489.1 hypothetical protein MYCFIDRAFT_198701 [Pseudocercospora fijiensis CIRAD86]
MAANFTTSECTPRQDDLSLQHKVDAAINEAISRGDPDLAVNMAQTHVNSFGNAELRSMLSNALHRADCGNDRQQLETYQSKLRRRYMPSIKHKKAYVRDTYQYAGFMRLLVRLRQDGKAKTEQRVAERLALELQREYSDNLASAAEGRVGGPLKDTESKNDSPGTRVSEAVDETAQCSRPAICSEVIEDDLVYSPPQVMTAKPSEHHANSAKAEVIEMANPTRSHPIPSVEVHTPIRPGPQKCEIQPLCSNFGERWYCDVHSITLCTARALKRHRREEEEGCEVSDDGSGGDEVEVARAGPPKPTPRMIGKEEPEAVMIAPRKGRYDRHGILIPNTAEDKELVKRFLAAKKEK